MSQFIVKATVTIDIEQFFSDRSIDVLFVDEEKIVLPRKVMQQVFVLLEENKEKYLKPGYDVALAIGYHGDYIHLMGEKFDADHPVSPNEALRPETLEELREKIKNIIEKLCAE